MPQEVSPMLQAINSATFRHERAHLDSNAVPMRLCELCSELSIDRFSDCGHGAKDYLQHQPSFTALEMSASSGCEMCEMFLGGLLKTHCEYNKCTPDIGYQTLRQRELQGRVTALIKPVWESGKMTVIGYFFDLNRYNQGVPSYTTWTYFILSYCQGSQDERLYKSELAPLADFGIARSLIEDCALNHPNCSNDESNPHAESTGKGYLPPQLPTRVIDVGVHGGVEPCLIVPGDHRAKYVTLSHCWGKTKPLVTDSTNLREHMNSMPLSKLPGTFRDAVIATRELGFRYLWIDSLCIVQDLPEDWDHECTRMATVYRNSSVTICGTAASDSYAGFLHERTPLFAHPNLWEYWDAESKRSKRATFRLWPYYPHFSPPRDIPELNTEERASPLDQRAWILQEYLLSPRILFFGPYRMYWECKTRARFENVSETAKVVDKGLHCNFTKRELVPPKIQAQRSEWGQWCKVIQEYTKRALTQPTDKLPALSGIADWFLGGHVDGYVAGLLKEEFLIGLTWRISTDRDLSPRFPYYRGPSWSWASTDCQIFSFLDGPERLKTQASTLLPIIESSSRTCKLDIHDISIELHSQNPFGAVKAGSLKLQGKVKRGIVVRHSRGRGPAQFNICDTEQCVDWIGTLFPDDDDQRWKKCWEFNLEKWQQLHEEQAGQNPVPESGNTDAKLTTAHSATSKSWTSSNRAVIGEVEIECLCINVNNNGWIGMAIEPIIEDPLRNSHGKACTEDKYKPYRRLGLLCSTDLTRAVRAQSNTQKATQWRFSWFEDAQSQLIELF